MGDPGPLVFVVGGADCVWDDLERAERMAEGLERVYIAINEIGADLEQVDHWVTLHPDRLLSWQGRRPGPKTWVTWTHNDPYDLADRTCPHPGGSSAGLACEIADTELGAARIVLIGCPMLARNTHYFDRPQPFNEADRFRREWVENGLLARWAGRVRSMSGWTQRMMGEPTTEWMRGEHGDQAAA